MISSSQSHDMKILNFSTIRDVVTTGGRQEKSHVVDVDNIQNASPWNSTGDEKGSVSSVYECCVDLDLESVVDVDDNVKRDCRICHLSMDMKNHDDDNNEFGTPIELGCSCKDDLAAAHKQCAEAWFKIKGNKTCEICGSIPSNVAGIVEVEIKEQWYEANNTFMLPPTGPSPPAETPSFLLNFLLNCFLASFLTIFWTMVSCFFLYWFFIAKKDN